MKVYKAKILDNFLIASYLPANYTDVFACEIEDAENITADDVQIAFWTKKPKWIDRLFDLRNAIVKPFGLKSGKETHSVSDFADSIRSGTDCGLASIPAKSENETVLCLNDKHLRAYISVFISDPENNRRQVYVTTLVHFHNWLGYAYFYAIYPFHYIVVRSMIKYTLKKMLAEIK